MSNKEKKEETRKHEICNSESNTCRGCGRRRSDRKDGKGFMVLIGVAQDDTRVIADKMVKKLTGLRIFEDENGKTNLA